MKRFLFIASIFLLYSCTDSDTPAPDSTPSEQEIDTTTQNSTEEPPTSTYSIQGNWTTTFEHHMLCKVQDNECSVYDYSSSYEFIIAQMECTADSIYFYNEHAPDNLYGKYSYEMLDSVTFTIDLGDITMIYGIFQMDWTDMDHLKLTNEFYNGDSTYFFSDIYFFNRDH